MSNRPLCFGKYPARSYQEVAERGCADCSELHLCYDETRHNSPDRFPRPVGANAPDPDSILQEAQKIIWGDREQTYGAPDINLKRIAVLWGAYIQSKNPNVVSPISFTPEDVCWMMTLLKMARQQHSPKRDNLVDAVGYVGLIERLP